MGFSDLTGGFSMLDGVASLNGQVGFVDITSNGGTIAITKPTASTINLESLSAGGSPLTTKGDIYTYSTTNDRLPVGTNGQVLSADSAEATGLKWITVSGTGTVTSVSVTTANGISGSVATATTTPAITLTLGAITPSSVASTGTVTGTNLSGTNTGDQTITLTGDASGSGTGSIAVTNSVNLTNTATLTNKRITQRVLALSANSATPAINTDNYDVVHITAQTAAITSFTTNLTGTPVDGDRLRISITGTGAVALTWGASFESSGNVTLPTTTVSTTRLDVGFFWNTESNKWRCTAAA